MSTTYPKCPTCESTGAECLTKGGNPAAVWHAKRVETRKHTYNGVEFELPASLHGKRLADALAPFRDAIDKQQADAPEPEPATGKCPKCKGYGVVRKLGPRKGDPYKTLNGSVEATAKGNSMPCPMCNGEAIIPAA